MRVQLKRSAPIEFTYAADGGEVSFVAQACTVGGYRRALELEAEKAKAEGGATAADRLLEQAVAMCGEECRPHLLRMDTLQLQEVVQAQMALYSGLSPDMVLEVMRLAKKKALTQSLLPQTPKAPPPRPSSTLTDSSWSWRRIFALPLRRLRRWAFTMRAR